MSWILLIVFDYIHLFSHFSGLLNVTDLLAICFSWLNRQMAVRNVYKW